MDVIAKMYLGFTVRGSQPYVFASEFRDQDRRDLKQKVVDDFLVRVSQATRDRWAGSDAANAVLVAVDANGFATEAAVRAAIQAEFAAYNTGKPVEEQMSLEFGTSAPPNEVHYIQTNDTRICIHTYGMLIGDSSKSFQQAATDSGGTPIPGGPTQTIVYSVSLAWEGGVSVTPASSGGGGA